MDQIDEATPRSSSSAPSYAEVLRELGISAKEMVHSEFALVKVELMDTARNVGNHAAQAVIFASLMLISVIPFMAFLVIALGDALDGRYWLSSLIVAAVFGLGGGIFAYRAYAKIRDNDLEFPVLQRVKRDLSKVEEKFTDVRTAAEGEAYDRLH